MKPFFLTLILVGLLIFGPHALARQEKPRALVIPCPSQDTPRRPTLKRRQPASDVSTPKEENNSEVTVEKGDCRPETEAETVQNENKPETEAETVRNENKLTVRFEGLVDVSESELFKILRERRIQLPKDPVQEQGIVEKASASIKEFLITQGYRHATVATRTEYLDGHAKALIFVITEGLRPRIAEFRFEGNKIFPSQQLAEEARQCMTHFERDFYDSEVFEYCMRGLDNFARGKGYLQAHFHDPVVDEIGGVLTITVHAREGILYRPGNIKIEGADFLDPERIRAMLPMQTGDIANGELISKWLFEELKKIYGDQGFIQYTADVTPEYKSMADGKEGVVDCLITIDEGHRFRVRKIFFVGEALPAKELGQLLLIRGGDLFNQTLFERSIEKLNDTGLFEPIDKDRDADFRTNEEERMIDISIKLTRKQI